MADDIIVGVVGVGVGVVALVGFVILSALLWCLWRNTKRDLIIMKYQVEKALSSPVATADPNLAPVSQLPQTPQPPPSPPSKPKPILTNDSKGYSSVNKLSLLPDEFRTEENLEGGTIPAETQEQVLTKYNKEREEYELKQFQKCEKMRASRGAVPTSPNKAAATVSVSLPTSTLSAGKDSNFESMLADRTPAYYDTVELAPHTGTTTTTKDDCFQAGMEDYGQPADALLLPPKPPTTVIKKPRTSPDRQKKIIMEATNGNQAYTPVFNPLTARQVDNVGPLRPTRVSSDTTPRHRYENNAVTPEGSRKEEEIGKRQDSGRASSNRRTAKEEVEFDPDKQRMFRMTSKKKKSREIGGEEEQVDGGDVDGGGVDGNLDSSPGSQGGESREEDKEAPKEVFVVQEGEGAALSYAMVNIADKRKNRMGADVVKCEGSGVPQRYVVPVSS